MSRRRQLLAAAATLALVGATGCTSDSVLDLQVGDCLDRSDLDGDRITSAQTVDCAEQHNAEIFGRHVFPGEDYPGPTAVREESQEACAAQFEDFIGVPYHESEILLRMLYPSQESWDDVDDRTTLCIALSEEPVTGSLQGAGV